MPAVHKRERRYPEGASRARSARRNVVARRHTYAFAVIVEGRSFAKARRAQDRVARALAAAR